MISSNILRTIKISGSAALLVILMGNIQDAGAQIETATSSGTATGNSRIARLSLEVQREEDLRAVKKLQISYAQYSQFGLWTQMATLFTDDAEAIYGTDDLKGRAAIGKYYLTEWGGGREGLAPGGIHTSFDDTPVVNLSADGKTAKGRWHEFSMTGQYGGKADWAGGIMENDYVKDQGVWKISRIHYYPVFAGPYGTGWHNATPDIRVVPYHYTAEETGIPIPPIPADLKIPAIKGSNVAALAKLSKRIQTLNDIDKVANLQYAYGYYLDFKLWDDVGDLFTDDAVLEVADIGIYSGAKSIRHYFDRFGPIGLQRGQLFDHPMFDMVVTIAPNGIEAVARGTEFAMLGTFGGTGSLGLSIFEDHFLKGGDGKWRIRERRMFPIMATDYEQGWAKSRIVPAAPTGEFAPDKPMPPSDTGTLVDGAIPVFFENNPVTGKPVALPKAVKVVGTASLLPAAEVASTVAPAASDLGAAIADAKRRLAVSTAYDGADNLSHAFANYIDDSTWHEEGLMFAEDGWRAKFAVAFCVGPNHVERCEREYDGDPPSPRLQQEIHWLSQPVINVAEDGQSATMRNRLLRFSTGNKEAGVFNNGMYPNNAAKLVNGAWKLDVMAIDEPYFSSRAYKDGWIRSRPSQRVVIVSNVTGQLPPSQRIKADVPRANMVIRYHGWLPGDTISWPDIKPMWFSYKNPVSDRLPKLYCPSLKTCEKELEAQKH